MYKSVFLDEFIEKFNNQGMCNFTIFFDLYEDYILKSGYDLKKEITENLLTLDPNSRELYLENVVNRINKEAFSSINKTFLDRWVVKYNLEELDFPYFKNEEIKIILSTWVDQPGLSYDEETNVRNIQKDFYYYAFHLEKMKIIEYIESKKNIGATGLKNNVLDDLGLNDSSATEPEIVLELDKIFKSKKGYEIFNCLLEHLGINTSFITKRRTQAKFNGIWGSPLSKKLIFKEHSELKDYIEFLNKTYNLSYKSRTMSDGSLYHDSIKNWLNEFYIE